MSTIITRGIQITATSRFEPVHSDVNAHRYLFSYRITIRNQGEETVQLMRRRWLIRDSLGPERVVEGPGVVGETPSLAPGEEFSYTSACDLRSGWGRMDGSYAMVTLPGGQPFEVIVPTIAFHDPYALN
jgi:ApaG protein